MDDYNKINGKKETLIWKTTFNYIMQMFKIIIEMLLKYCAMSLSCMCTAFTPIAEWVFTEIQ